MKGGCNPWGSSRMRRQTLREKRHCLREGPVVGSGAEKGRTRAKLADAVTYSRLGKGD